MFNAKATTAELGDVNTLPFGVVIAIAPVGDVRYRRMLPRSRQTRQISLDGGDATRPLHDKSDHILQLFDTNESLAETVAAFLAEGDVLGESLLVVCTEPHWHAIVEAMRTIGCDPIIASGEGRLTVLDAANLLSRFMRRGEPSRALFEQSVGTLVRRLSAESGGRLRIYGEMVELPAQEGNYAAAEHLEQRWNELGATTPFRLLCGYSAAHFAAPDAGSALAAICAQHTKLVTQSQDPLAEFLLHIERSRADSVNRPIDSPGLG